MITIVQGKPGSGKTYYCMYHLLKTYYEYNSGLMCYVPKRNIVVVSNIEGLKLEHESLDDLINEHGIEKAFSEAYVNHLRDKYDCKIVIYLIDEAQKAELFHKKFYNEKVFYFFQYHRHYGVDVYLITQDVFSMPKQITTLSEYYLKAVQRSLKFNRGFIYKKMIDEEVLTNSVLPVDIKVFRMYSSYKVEETEKPKSAYTKFVVLCVILLLFTIVMFKYVFLHLFVHDKKKSVNVADKSNKVGVVNKDKVIPKYKVFEYDNLIKTADLKDNKIVVKAVSTDAGNDNKMIVHNEEKKNEISVINELYIIIKHDNTLVKMNLDYNSYQSALNGCKLSTSGEVEGFARQIYECNNGSKKIVYDDKRYENSSEVFGLENKNKSGKNKNQFDTISTTNGKPLIETPLIKKQ